MACYNKVKKDWPARSDTPVSLFADPKLPPPKKKGILGLSHSPCIRKHLWQWLFSPSDAQQRSSLATTTGFGTCLRGSASNDYHQLMVVVAQPPFIGGWEPKMPDGAVQWLAVGLSTNCAWMALAQFHNLSSKLRSDYA